MPVFRSIVAVFMMLATCAALTGCPAPEPPPRYTILVENLSTQPLGPVFAVTHNVALVVWEDGQLASSGMGELAETGSTTTLENELRDRTQVSDTITSALPMPAQGLTVPRFSPTTVSGPDLVDQLTLSIETMSGDQLSIVGGLLGTNDGFWGLDRAYLPKKGTFTYLARGYDAGTEENNELEDFINDDASILGPAVIPGDERGEMVEADNRRDPTTPPVGIRPHDGILGENDIPVTFDFDGSLVRVTITRDNAP